MNEPAVLATENLEFRYRPQDKPILHDLNLTVARGEFVALLGSNGAGKTTLAKHFNGLHRPTRGRVLLGGRSTAELSLAEMAQTVGYCYQNPDHQIFASSVEKEIRFGPANLGLPAKQVDQNVRDAMVAVGLTSVASANPFVLGRGRRQLLAVASILAMNPQVLVIDEPTTGLDLSGARQIMNLLARWNQDGRTIVVITHDMDLVMEYVQRCVIMAHGRIIADGPVSEIMRRNEVLLEAHLLAPPVVTIADRLAPFGAQRRRMLAEVTADVQEHMEARHASRL